MKRWMHGLGVVAIAGVAASSQGAILIDGNFSDWDDIPVLATSIDNGIDTSPDFAELKVTNDADFVYFLYTLHDEQNPQAGAGVLLAIDSDNNTSTGFNVFGLGIIGSEAGWQNDFPFEQATGVFNTGAGLTNATYLAAPFGAATTAVEISIPRAALRNSGGAVFPGDGETIGVLFYTDAGGLTDYIGGAYTMVPEPATAVLTLAGLGLFAIRRR